MKTRRQIIIAKVLAGVLFVGGIALIVGTHLGYRDAKDSPNWPTADGMIIESRIVGVGGGVVGSGVKAKVRYVYDVKGSPYKGWRITYQRKRGDRSQEHAQKVAARYSAGSMVRVYYRSGRPSVSVLEPGSDRYPIVGGILLAAIFMGTAILVWTRPISRNGPTRSGGCFYSRR